MVYHYYKLILIKHQNEFNGKDNKQQKDINDNKGAN